MGVRFEQEAWLWAALVAVPLAITGWVLFRAMSASRRWTAIVVRTLLVMVIAGLLAGAATVQESDAVAVVAVVDASGSVRRFVPPGGPGEPLDPVERVRGLLGTAWKRRGPDDLMGVVAFDGRAWVVAAPSRADPSVRDYAARPVEGSDIGSALRLARALAPPEAATRILLASDGVGTGSDGVEAAREARAAGIRVDVLALAYRLEQEVVVESLDAPPVSGGEATVTLRVGLRAAGPARGTVRLMREGAEVDLDPAGAGAGKAVSLGPGLNIVPLEVRLPPGRVHRFTAVFEPAVTASGASGTEYAGDTVLANNRAEAFTLSPGRGSILVLDGVSEGEPGGAGSILAQVWRDAGMEVSVVPAGGLPEGLLGLEAYDLIVLQNVPAEAVSPEGQESLVRYVRDMGGGLVMVGGPASFAAGGWKGSVLEPILPVLLDLPQRAVAPETATVFVIDNSGSMRHYVLGSARTQQEIANAATALAIRSLDSRDLVGVITFNSGADIVVPLGPNRDPAGSERKVMAVFPGGGTNAVEGLELARTQLATGAAGAKVKHIVVLSDGKSRGDEQLAGMCAALARDGVRVSTIAVGDDAALRTMADMAREGNGTFYHAANPDALPQIFLKAVRAVRSPLVREEAFTPVVRDGASPLMAGVGAVPELGGLALTTAREEAAVQTALMTARGEPVLAHWNVGLGRVVAFTSDGHAWGKGWLDWPGYARLWTGIARQTARAPASRGVMGAAVIDGATLRVRVEAPGEDGLACVATIFAPSGSSREVSLSHTGPGIYEAGVPAYESGTYVALVRSAGEGTGFPPVLAGATRREGAEYRSASSDDAGLGAIASAGGGRVVTGAEVAGGGMFDRAGMPVREALLPLRGTLLIVALGLFLADVATRRVAWDRWISREFGAGEGEAALRARRERGDAAGRTLAGLRERLGAGPGEPGAGALTEEDAKRLAAAARDQRRARRLQEIAGRSPAPIAPAARTEGAQDEGLLGAKKRALRRFEEE